MFRWIIFLLTVASLTQDSSGKNLLDACKEDGECPSDSKCTIRGCDGSICLCRGNLIPNLNYTKCVSFAEIGESCTGSKFCRPVSSRCDHVKGECTCQNGYSTSSSNNKVIYCKQKPLLSTSTSFSLLKEPCDENRQRCSPENHLECDKGVCVCSNGYKEASIDIINAYPFNVVQCVPVNFSIGIKIEENQCFSPAPVTPRPTPGQTSNAIPLPTTDQFSSEFVSTFDIPSLSTDFGQTSPSASLTSFPNLQPTPAITPSTYETQKYSSGVPELSSTDKLEESSAYLFSSTILPRSNAAGLVSETNLETQQTLHYTSISSPYTSFISDLLTSSESYTKTLSSVTVTSSNTDILSTSSPDIRSSSQPTSTLVGSSEVIFSSFMSSSETPVQVETSFTMSSSKSNIITSMSSASFVTSVLPTSQNTNTVKSSMVTFPVTFSSEFVTPKSSVEETATLFTSSSEEFTKTIQPTPSQSSSSQNLKSSSVLTTTSISTPPPPTSKTPKTTENSVVTTTEVTTTANSVVTKDKSTASRSTTIATTKRTTSQQTTRSATPIGERCQIDSVCPENAICETRSKCDGNLACYCKEGYVSNENNEKCLKIQYLRGKCVSNNQCLGPNAACIGGLCACTEGYLSSSNNTRCRREMSWFVSFPLLGDRCMGFLSSCYNYDEQECKNERCVCKEGYRPLLEVERKLRHKEFSQCVKNDTLPDAFKENIRCTDMTASDYSDPYYSEGKRKIRVMQGAIIGGIMAFLVLILTAVGIILYIRYKKRTGDMNNDSGSEISFERQSSGRYSFKIPRPFATYDTTPADNLSFHNRSFKEDETHRLREDELKSLNGTLAKFYFDDIDYKPHEEYRPHENGK
ncbi:uncharacterized protein [Magallana gigas]|uniref:uncharacterized protein n=1 Tax=Magallana gigas TaxID=29159 RepID=UPI0033427832